MVQFGDSGGRGREAASVDGDSARVGALARGLRVLAALNDLTDASVGDLAAASGVAKTTVLRSLHTLSSEGYVAQSEGRYRVTGRVSDLSRGLVDADIRRRSVQPILDGLAKLRWPVEFLLADGLFMAITMNNRDRAPIKLALFDRRRFPLLESAAGIAYLAALPPGERRALVARAAAGDDEAGAALRWARRAARAGFAVRDLRDLSPGLQALAVPVGGPPLGALVIVLFRDLVPDHVLAGEVLPRLRTAADEIAIAMHENDHGGPA